VDSWLRDLYPAAVGDHWGVLGPDRLAEHHVGVLAAKDPSLVDLLLAGATDRQAAQALAMLKRATAHQRHLTEQLHDVLARRRTRLERVAVAMALMARDPSLNLAAGVETVYETVGVEDRQIIWQRWLGESEREY
jgi:uncharacterized coiled-coil protein SlyX